jgi:hypothetical protein
VNALVWQMLQMEFEATIGIITFQAHWSSLEWLPLTNFHLFDKFFNVLCAFSKLEKFGSTSFHILCLKATTFGIQSLYVQFDATNPLLTSMHIC